MHIEMGDDGRYRVIDIGTVTFQRESNYPLTLKYVMYFPSLEKNLASVSMLEDRGYDVIFSKEKAFLCHIASGKVKRIEFWVKNLYKLDVEECNALSKKVEKVQSQDISELWHRIFGHLHHRASKIMQEIFTRLRKIHAKGLH